MKFENLKTIFAATAVAIGVSASTNDAYAQNTAVTAAQAAITMGSSGKDNKDSKADLHPWDEAYYEQVVKKMSPERQELYDNLLKAIADPATTSGDIKALFGNRCEGFGSEFGREDASHLRAARKTVLGDGHENKVASPAEVREIMFWMDAKSRGKFALIFMLSTVGLIVGGAYATTREERSMRSAKTLKP